MNGFAAAAGGKERTPLKTVPAGAVTIVGT